MDYTHRAEHDSAIDGRERAETILPSRVVSARSIAAALPAQAKEIADIIGLKAALTICERIGGSKVWVPEQMPRDEHWLVRALGAEITAKLVWAWGCAELQVPMLSAAVRLMRDSAIRADFDDGASMRVLPRRYSLTRRQVMTILKRAAPA